MEHYTIKDSKGIPDVIGNYSDDYGLYFYICFHNVYLFNMLGLIEKRIKSVDYC